MTNGERTGVDPPRSHILVTERDSAVLMSLYDNIVMTFSQIQRRHFCEVAKPTVINRLSKLEHAGFLSRERIPRMTLGLDEKAVGVVFQITKLGIGILRERHHDKEFKPQPIRIHPYSLNHDLILNDLAQAIEVRWPGCKIINGRHAMSGAPDGKTPEPDLIVTLAGTNEQMAIELELHDKSERRYREIILRYRLQSQWPKVIYFVARPDIQRLMTRVILNRHAFDGEKPETGTFYFANLFEFQNHPRSVAITNGADDLVKTGGKI